MTDCLIKNKLGACAQSVVIIGRRWFDKTYGNTYHSAEVYVDGESIGREDYAYGYDDQYIQTAHELLQKAGCIQKTDRRFKSGVSADWVEFRDDMRNNRKRYVVSVSDVERKKDL
jgi:hypothetical protein